MRKRHPTARACQNTCCAIHLAPPVCVAQGGIKPCVSAHVGDQFTTTNEHLLSKTFGYFYFSINAGSFVSTLLTPYLLATKGPHLAFGLPGVLMCLATFAFWSGRWHYAHIPAQGCTRGVFTVVAAVVGTLVVVVPVVSATVSVSVAIFAVVAIVVVAIAAAARLGRLLSIYVFVAMFWALYDQTGSAWVQQAERMDRSFMGVEWLNPRVTPLLANEGHAQLTEPSSGLCVRQRHTGYSAPVCAHQSSRHQVLAHAYTHYVTQAKNTLWIQYF